MITRNNYEEFFLLYSDNELTTAEKEAVEEFVKENPDLSGDFDSLRQLKLKPENNIVFGNKDALLRMVNDHSLVNKNNCEEYFLLYTDNELSDEEKKSVEKFVANNPALRIDFEILINTLSRPDVQVIFQDKESLYKQESKKIVFLPWMRIAAAAIILLSVGLFVFDNFNKKVIHTIASTGNNADETRSKKMADQRKTTMTVTSRPVDSLNFATATINKVGNRNHKFKQIKKMQIGKNTKIMTRQVHLNELGVEDPDVSKTIATVAIPKSSGALTKLPETREILVTAPKVVILNIAALSTSTNANDDLGDINYDKEDKLIITNTSSKKNRLRGFFRQVSRAFNKTAHVGDENNDAVLIGSFRVALK